MFKELPALACALQWGWEKLEIYNNSCELGYLLGYTGTQDHIPYTPGFSYPAWQRLAPRMLESPGWLQ